MAKETDLLEMIEKESLARCEILETDDSVYVERINKSDWIGMIVVGIVFAIILAAGWN